MFKVVWWYGIVGFGVLQAADIALPRLELPDWTVTFMLAVMLLAFPVAVMLAWAFEMTPEGVCRAEEASAEEIAALVESGTSAAAEQWMWFGYPDSAVAVYDVGPDEIFQLDLYRIWRPVFDPIRDRPEIQAFLRNAGLEGAQLQRTPRSEGGSAGAGEGGSP